MALLKVLLKDHYEYEIEVEDGWEVPDPDPLGLIRIEGSNDDLLIFPSTNVLVVRLLTGVEV